jgi:hypothetical protein
MWRAIAVQTLAGQITESGRQSFAEYIKLRGNILLERPISGGHQVTHAANFENRSRLHSLLKNYRFVSGLAFRRAVTEIFSMTPSGAEVDNRNFSANCSAPEEENFGCNNALAGVRCFREGLFLLCEKLVKFRDEFLEFRGIVLQTDLPAQFHDSIGVCLGHLAAPVFGLD